MSNNPRRLGKYVLKQRYKNTEDLGRLFRARNAETGAPALVLEHTARQSFDVPVADWTLLVRSTVAPAHLALEVVESPEAADSEDAREELECALEDLHLALAHALKSPETLRHLRSPPKTDAREEVPVLLPWRHRALGVALTACLTLLVLRAGNSNPPVDDWSTRPELAEARGDGGWEDDEGNVTGAALVGLNEFEPITIGRQMPKKPFGIQKRPPCNKTIEEEHVGGCWVLLKAEAPCPDDLYELKGLCYLPAVKAPPPPPSVAR